MTVQPDSPVQGPTLGDLATSSTHPTAAWITQQLREAFPYDQAPRYLILDRDAKYGSQVLAAIRTMGIRAKQITPRSPWQNGVAERFVSTARRDLFEHVIVLNEKHPQRLRASFRDHYLEDRTHVSLMKDAPAMRAVEQKEHLVQPSTCSSSVSGSPATNSRLAPVRLATFAENRLRGASAPPRR